jgi:hypothetical protein
MSVQGDLRLAKLIKAFHHNTVASTSRIPDVAAHSRYWTDALLAGRFSSSFLLII